MREIKFRGCGKDKKQWIYGSLLDEKSVGIVAIQDGDCHVWEVDPATVGQFTGLCDCEGKEIYEGDIVQVEGWTKTTVVSWAPYLAMFVIDRDLCLSLRHGYVHVIGNIHDNPELLKEGGE